MLFIILMILFIILLPIILPPPGSEFTGKKDKSWCPPHIWIYGTDGFLYCKECHQKPGYEGRE